MTRFLVIFFLATAVPALGQERVQPQAQPRPAVQPLPRIQPQPAARPAPRAEAQPDALRQPSPEFERLRQRALAARSPGGRPDAESMALLKTLETQYASRVETENAKIQALARVVSTRLRPAVEAPNAPADAEVSGQNDDLGLDPCGLAEAPLEVESIQATPPLDPGEWVLLEGCGLGTSPGELRLVGDFPGGHVKLQVNYWSSRHISAELPLVTGVGDMPAAKLQVKRHDGKLSGWVDVGGFRATREVKRIHPTDVAVTCTPKQGYTEGDCTLAQSHPLSESQFFGGASFAARHVGKTYHNFQSVEECNDYANSESGTSLVKLGINRDGSDVAVVNLANGWTLAGYAWWWDHPAGSGYVQQPTGFNVNASSANVNMAWGVFLNECYGPKRSEVRYRVDLYAVGPRGVPYK